MPKVHPRVPDWAADLPKKEQLAAMKTALTSRVMFDPAPEPPQEQQQQQQQDGE